MSLASGDIIAFSSHPFPYRLRRPWWRPSVSRDQNTLGFGAAPSAMDDWQRAVTNRAHMDEAVEPHSSVDLLEDVAGLARQLAITEPYCSR